MRFAREVAAARAVGGAFTAPLIDADPDAQRPWLVTTYLPGHSLQATVDRYGPLPPASVRSLAAGLAEALVGIHRAGVVHRDLKPSNVLLTPDGARVIDFGIARAADSRHGDPDRHRPRLTRLPPPNRHSAPAAGRPATCSPSAAC